MPCIDNIGWRKRSAMPRLAERKKKWTLWFNPTLKKLVVTKARNMGVRSVILLENLVREKLNPYGHMGVDDSAAYITAIRKQRRKLSDNSFLKEIQAWDQSQSS
jgi:hypothetical protein